MTNINPLLWHNSVLILLGFKYEIVKNKISFADLTYYYLPSVLYGVSGGAFNFFLLCFSYLGDLVNSQDADNQNISNSMNSETDLTNDEIHPVTEGSNSSDIKKVDRARLVRFSTTETAITVGTVLGYFIIKLMNSYVREVWIFVFTASCFSAALVYAVIRLQDIKPFSVS